MSEPNRQGCWYLTYRHQCVLCGYGTTTRERKPPPAPPKAERYEYEEYACDAHFL